MRRSGPESWRVVIQASLLSHNLALLAAEMPVGVPALNGHLLVHHGSDRVQLLRVDAVSPRAGTGQ